MCYSLCQGIISIYLYNHYIINRYIFECVKYLHRDRQVLGTKKIKPKTKDIATFIHHIAIHEPLRQEKFNKDKDHFADILDDYVDGFELRIIIIQNFKCVLHYWWRQIFIENPNVSQMDIYWMIDIVGEILKQILPQYHIIRS